MGKDEPMLRDYPITRAAMESAVGKGFENRDLVRFVRTSISFGDADAFIAREVERLVRDDEAYKILAASDAEA